MRGKKKKKFDSDQFPEQVQINTSQTNFVATEGRIKTRELCIVVSIYSPYQITPSKSQEEQPSQSLVLQGKFMPFKYLDIISLQDD